MSRPVPVRPRRARRAKTVVLVTVVLAVAATAGRATLAGPVGERHQQHSNHPTPWADLDEADVTLGPWQVERLLYPYALDAVPSVEEPHPGRACARLAWRVMAMTRKCLSVVEQATHALHRRFEGLVEIGTWVGGHARRLPQPGVDAMRNRYREIKRGLGRLPEALERLVPGPGPGSDRDTPRAHRDSPAAAADPFDLQGVRPFDDVLSPVEPWTVRPAALGRNRQRPAGKLGAVFLQATGVAFLAALALVPAGCSFTAGAVYGHPRDGP